MQYEQDDLDLSQVVKSTQSSNSNDQTSHSKDLQHGDYVVDDDGVSSMVIQNDYTIQQMMKNDSIQTALHELIDPNNPNTLELNYEPIDYGKDVPEGYDPGVEYINNNPYDNQAIRMKEVKDAFANYTYGLDGLVPIGSDEARIVQQAFEDLRTGKVVLPTPEEYEQQKKQLQQKKRNKQTVTNKEKQEKPFEQEKPTDSIIKPIDVTQDETMFTVKQSLDSQLEQLNHKEKEKPTMTEQENKPTETPVEEVSSNVLNLAEMEEEVKTIEPSYEQQEEEKDKNIVQVSVPKGEAETFIQSLPIETYNNIKKAEVLQINEITTMDVPIATRSITNVSEYRRLVNRRYHNTEVAERVLINSGFVVTVKPASSLEMAVIFKTPDNPNIIDYEKAYQFAYDHTVSTSIGKLSYNDFVYKVYPLDIDTILQAIYEISESPKKSITIDCGNRSCRNSYEITLDPSTLPDTSNLDEKSVQRIKTIADARTDLEKAKEIQSQSPPMIVKYLRIRDITLSIRLTNGYLATTRSMHFEAISDAYGPIVALLSLYIDKVFIHIKERPDSEEETFEVTDINMICEELRSLTDDDVTMIKALISDGFTEYKTIEYRIKGPIQCPVCGNIEEYIPCTIQDLIFQKVRTLLS